MDKLKAGTRVFFYPGLIDQTLYPMLAGEEVLTGILVYDQTPGSFSVISISGKSYHMNNKEVSMDNDKVFLTEEEAITYAKL